MGEVYICGNYEYHYGQTLGYFTGFNEFFKEGWGVAIIDNSQVDYDSPLTEIQGFPVVNMNYIFCKYHNKMLNLINWDVVNVGNMSHMFRIVMPLSSMGYVTWPRKKIRYVESMFGNSCAANLDLSNFDMSNVKSADLMFESDYIESIIAMTQSDADNYKKMPSFPKDATIVVAE